MRVGKFVEHFRAAAVAGDARALDPVLRYLTVGRQLGYAGYMLCDNAAVVSYTLSCRSYGWIGQGNMGRVGRGTNESGRKGDALDEQRTKF